MRNLKGKCKSCLGCNLLEDFGFKGRKKCENYIRANKEECIIIIIAGLIEIVMFIGLGFYAWYRISILAGG